MILVLIYKNACAWKKNYRLSKNVKIRKKGST